MSRIGNKHIVLPEKVSIDIQGSTIAVKGPLGTLSKTFSPLISVKVEEGNIVVTRANDEKATKQLHGTTRALLNNMVNGVNVGFKKNLTIVGRGYTATQEGANLKILVGYSHPVIVTPLLGTTIKVVPGTKIPEIEVSGLDKEIVGQMAAEIRSIREPEPYKGKGISYKGENIRRKQGKKAQKK
ncbi:MAG: 50S ribosomal protein L6 [Bacillales bacterium]|jgi:large subunit ribosomal protein L6|nr:50S ribosomal protein L6 [Bacillales bacterium]